MATCRTCGITFKGTRKNHFYCSDAHREQGVYQLNVCLNCGVEFKTFRYKPRECHSKKCAQAIANHDERNMKRRQTCLERHGVEYPTQIPGVTEKREQTCLEIYGVKNPAENMQVKRTISTKRREYKNKPEYKQLLIYEIRNINNNKVYYGSTVQKPNTRWNSHRKKLIAGSHVNPHLQHAWNKHGKDAFVFKVIEECASFDEMNQREMEYIAGNQGGYNMRAGGNNGGKHSEEMIEKQRARMLGRKWSPEAIQKRIDAVVPNGYPAVVDPDGIVHTFKNMRAFCTEHTLQSAGLRNIMFNGHTQYKGWRLATEDTIGIKMSWDDETHKHWKRNNSHIRSDKGTVHTTGRYHSSRPGIKIPIKYVELNGYPDVVDFDGNVYSVDKLIEFCTQHAIQASGLRQIMFDGIEQYRGWRLANEHTIGIKMEMKRYLLISPEGQEFVVENVSQFCREYELNSGCIFMVINGTRQLHKGWAARVWSGS